MAKFKVGDRVESTRNGFINGWRNPPEGIYGVIVGICGNGKGDGDIEIQWDGWDDSWYYGPEHIVSVSDELTTPRQFKADAIARYPDLEPLSAEEKFTAEIVQRYWDDDLEGPGDVVREAIRWARDNPR